MEIVPGIHRIEPYIGKKLLAHHLIVGDRSLLVDAGTADLARECLVPWLAEVLGDPARLDMILITHGDVDHYGGLAALREAAPHATIIAPARDRRWIENPDAIFAERYDAYHFDHGRPAPPDFSATFQTWHGPPIPVDVGLVGGEDLRWTNNRLLRVVHVPGHTPGHLMLWDAQDRIAIIGDALNGATQIDQDGAWTAPPPYNGRDLYLTSIGALEALAPEIVLGGHYPIMRGRDVQAFIDASRDFVFRADAALTRLLGEAGEPLTLTELVDLADPILGPFGSSFDLQSGLESELIWLERNGTARRMRRDGLVAWERAGESSSIPTMEEERSA